MFLDSIFRLCTGNGTTFSYKRKSKESKSEIKDYVRLSDVCLRDVLGMVKNGKLFKGKEVYVHEHKWKDFMFSWFTAKLCIVIVSKILGYQN